MNEKEEEDRVSLLCDINFDEAEACAEGVKKYFADNFIDVNARNKLTETRLHAAAARGLRRATRVLIEAGAKVNAQDQYGWTPLHDAAYWGYSYPAKLLIDAGADVNVKNGNGETPLDVAKEYESEDVEILLIAAGAR